MLPPELSGEISQKVNLILSRFLNQFPRGRDQFAFYFFLLSHLGWYFTRVVGIFRVLSLHRNDPQSIFLKEESQKKKKKRRKPSKDGEEAAASSVHVTSVPHSTKTHGGTHLLL